MKNIFASIMLLIGSILIFPTVGVATTNGEILSAAKSVFHTMQPHTVKGMVAVINDISFTVHDGTPYLIFNIESVNMPADHVRAIAKKDGDDWVCIYWGNGGPAEEQWLFIENDTEVGYAFSKIRRSLILNFSCESVYFADQYVQSYNDNQLNNNFQGQLNHN